MIYWVSGMAGTGKSTIALTLARAYKRAFGMVDRSEAHVSLAATFFFSRGGGDLSSASRFPATIAIQLAEVSGQFREAIARAVEDNPRLESLGIQEQWETLIIRPLSPRSQYTATNPSTLLLIIDALDECDSAQDIQVIMRCLERVTHATGVRCRVFLTSRPDLTIGHGFDDSASLSRESFVLHDIERSIVDQDLKIYYRDQLSRLKSPIPPEESTISEITIQKLVERSNGLFIHAATVCRFVRDGGWLAFERLTRLVETQKSDSAELELNRMYKTVLEYSFASVTDGLTQEEVEKVHQLFQRIVGAIMVSFDAMSPDSLAILLEVKWESIFTTLSAFHSVIDVPKCQYDPIRILHPTFREYLLNPNNRGDKFHSIVAKEAHGYLLTGCFACLMSQLRRNILDISNPGAKAQKVSAGKINACISRELQYSSRYWWDHFQNSDNHSRTEFILLEFLEHKYLFWLECLAWSGKLGHAIEAMSNVDAILYGKSSHRKSPKLMLSDHPKSNKTSQLQAFVPDALHFLLSNKLMIEEAPLQLYVSGLIFSPKSSQPRKQSRKEAPSWILKEPRMPENWSESYHGLSIAHSFGIDSVAISPDSRLVATACGHHVVQIWDATSGTRRFKLVESLNGWPSVCFSPNGRLVASVVQDCLSVWNIQSLNGVRSQPDFQLSFKRLGSWAGSPPHETCAFSPDENLVAVADMPRDIWVWDMRAKKSVKYHFQVERARRITGVYFSSDESLLISIVDTEGHGRFSETIHAWNTSTGVKVPSTRTTPKEIWLGTMPGTRYISISPGASNEGASLVVRDARDGSDSMQIPLGPHLPTKALYRPADRNFLLASFKECDIFLWMLGDSRERTILKSHCSRIKSISFSPNGNFLMSINESNELRIWNIEGFGSKPSRLMELYKSFQGMRAIWGRQIKLNSSKKPSQAPSGDFNVWVRSPDGSLLATGAYQGPTMVIWDTRAGEEKFSLNVPKTLRPPQFSPSGNLFAVLAESGIHFWETNTGKQGEILNIDGRQTLGPGDLSISQKGSKVIYIESYGSEKDGPEFDQISRCYGWELDGIRKISNFEIPIYPRQNLRISFSENEERYCLWGQDTNLVEIGSFPNNVIRHRYFRESIKRIGLMPDGENVWILSELDGPKLQGIQVWNIGQGGLKESHIHLPKDSKSDLVVDHDDDNISRHIVYRANYTEACLSPNGELLALTCRKPNSANPQIDLWETSGLNYLFTIQLGFQAKVVRFSPCGTYLITERGNGLLPGSSPQFPLLFATRSWIQENDKDILAIPPAYRNSFAGIHGHTITFRDPAEGPLFVRLDEGVKTMNY
ncbi:unnamed protein product [Penicillium olsonii]|nr:unnamed protein product [Penicillium olsonii]CAG7927348.1 unnamed protein product [Penicillium olsonii]